MLWRSTYYSADFGNGKAFLEEKKFWFNEELRYGEDIQFMWRVFPALKGIACTQMSTYKYLQRTNSLMTSQNVDRVKKLIDIFSQTINELKIEYPEDKKIWRYLLQMMNSRINKGKFAVSENNKAVEGAGICDAYTTAFLNGLTYTENCYECQYAKRERISDITLGDSWGSELSVNEQKAGISLILCNTEKGKWLVENSDIDIMNVDVEKAISANHQLSYPSTKPKFRDEFFEKIKAGNSFTKMVYRYYPKQQMKNIIKKTLIKLHILGGVK